MRIPDLVRAEVDRLALFSSSMGVYSHQWNGIRQIDNGSPWNTAIDKIRSLNLPEADPPFFIKEETYLHDFIRQANLSNYLRFLTDINEEIRIAGLANPSYQNRIERDGDNAGLVSTIDHRIASGCFVFEETPIFICPSKLVAFNSNIGLFPLLCEIARLRPIRIRPDVFQMHPLGRAGMRKQADRVFGKTFDGRWLDQLRGREMASHAPREGQSGELTQFCWEERSGNEVHLSCEELPSISEDSDSAFVTCRFVHAVYQKKNHSFEHLDGAIHIYEKTNYETRLEAQLSGHYMDYAKAKIFKIDDATLSIDQVGNISKEFFHWNSMVEEYFFGQGR